MSKKGRRRERARLPVATVAYYGPDDKIATKVAVGIVNEWGKGPVELKRWWGQDVARDAGIQRQIADFIRAHGARSVAITEGIIGCPHEEGIDFPSGQECPYCSFWRGKQQDDRASVSRLEPQLRLSNSYKQETTETVSFVTTEDGNDLIVSFAVVPGDDSSDVKSLILLRTPKYESILDDAERGVSVSYDDFPDDEDDYLEKVEAGKDVVKLVTSRRRYTLDITHVDEDEKRRMERVLKKMNFDGRFELKML